MRGLLILVGDHLEQAVSRIRGKISSLHEQELASYSHIDFIKYLKRKKYRYRSFGQHIIQDMIKDKKYITII